MTSPKPTAPETPTIAEEPRGPVIEWFSIDGLEFQDAAKLLELIDILREIRRQPGCRKVLRQDCGESSVPDFLVIEWRDARARTQFLESEGSQRFAQAIEGNQLRRTLLIRLPQGGGVGVFHGFADLTHNLPEVLTAHFPTSLSDTATQALDRIGGPENFGGPMSGHEIAHPLSSPYEGLLGKHHGWADGIVEYQGQPTRRMIYIFKWLDELAQQRYRQEAKIKKRTRDGRTLWDAMDVFLDDLEDLGMLGYETRNAKFLDVLGFYLPSDPGYAKGVNDSDTLRR
ncbi:hypothetical protein SCUP515_10245 [Seiridium cupressi]